MTFSISPPSVKSISILVAGWLVGALTLYAVQHSHVHFPRPKPPAPAPQPRPDWFGWSPDAPQRKVVSAQFRPLATAAPGLMRARDASDGRPILLYKAWTDVFRDYPPYGPQEIGDCVSFGHGHANDLLQCISWIMANGERGSPPTANDIQETDTEDLYAMMREAGGMLGRGDGGVGAFAVKAMCEMGMVSRRQLGSDRVYSGERARAWGRTGAPDSVKQLASKYKLGSAVAVTTWDELVAALHNGCPVTICTGRGFNLERDGQGFCRMQGNWGHCMFIAGVRFDRAGACIIQSWGPNQPSGPTSLDQPAYSFWADRRAIEAILSEGDSYAISKSPNFGASSKSRKALPDHWRKAA
jgi:hypothetical protein